MSRILILNPPPSDTNLITDSSVSREVGMSSFKYIYPPLGLAYIAAVLEAEGHRCKIIDGNIRKISIKLLVRNILDFSPDFVVIQVPPSLLNNCIKISNLLKNKTIVVHVGPFTTAMPELTLKKGTKFVIRGEPEDTISDFVNSDGSNLSVIKGLSYVLNDQIYHNPDRPLISNLDNIPFPARYLLDNNKYFVPFNGKPVTTIITSRGCPFDCIFCPTRIYYGNIWRKRTIVNVVDEIIECVNKYKLNHICFWDDTFNVNIERAKELCKTIIAEGLDIEWFCLSRVDRVNFDLLALMKKSGCYHIQYGVESASQKILDNIRKGITIEQIRKTFALTKKAGIETTAFFMFGNPGETNKTIKETISFAKEIDPDYARFCLATPFPKTEFFNNFNNKKQINWAKTDILHSYNSENISTVQLNCAIKMAYRDFYFRPKVIFREFKKLNSLDSIIHKVSQLGWLIKNN